MKTLICQLAHSVRDLVYPPLCLHCNATIHGDFESLCGECFELLQKVDASDRCPYCFNVNFRIGSASCDICRRRERLLNGCAATYDYIGPAATLVRQLKYGNQPYFVKGLGAMMAMQFIDLGWPIPDLIVPVPISWTHWLGRGYNQSLLLAEVISSILGSPVKDIIKRQSGDYSQAGLSRSSRLKLSKGNFSLKPNADVADRVVLLIDDVMTTGSTLRRCAEQLLIQCPREIYALTLCCAE